MLGRQVEEEAVLQELVLVQMVLSCLPGASQAVQVVLSCLPGASQAVQMGLSCLTGASLVPRRLSNESFRASLVPPCRNGPFLPPRCLLGCPNGPVLPPWCLHAGRCRRGVWATRAKAQRPEHRVLGLRVIASAANSARTGRDQVAPYCLGFPLGNDAPRPWSLGHSPPPSNEVRGYIRGYSATWSLGRHPPPSNEVRGNVIVLWIWLEMKLGLGRQPVLANPKP